MLTDEDCLISVSGSDIVKTRVLVRSPHTILFCIACLLLVLVPAHAAAANAHMNLSLEDIEEEERAYDTAPIYVPVSSISAAPSSLTNDFPKTSYDDWNQGSCGNCWVWAGTGALAQSLYKSTGTSTPLSIQFFNSNYLNGNIGMTKPHEWACTGGFPGTFAEIYSNGVNQSYPGGPFVIPWSNVNASYKDDAIPDREDQQTTMPRSLIGLAPNTGIDRIEAERVLDKPANNQTAAVEKIIRTLVDGKVIYYVMTLPNQSAWNRFSPDFWSNEPDATWDMDVYNQSFYNSTSGEGSGHAMVVIGYNRTDPAQANQYWIVQNSWGTSDNRSTGQYRLKMWMDYNATFNNTGGPVQEFWVFNTSWKTGDPTVSSIAPSSGMNGRTVSFTNLAGTNFGSSADVMLKRSAISPWHAGSLANGSGGALLGDPSKVRISGNYAYITGNSSNTLEIVNLDNPFVPVHEGTISNGDGGAALDGPMDVVISGSSAVVASYRSNAIEIIDISNPKSPVHQGTIAHGAGGALLNGPQSIAVSGDLVYVASTGSNALEIINISTPSAPVHVASVVNGAGGALLSSPYDLAIVPDTPYVYIVSNGNNALEIVNVTVPAAPAHMASIANGAGGALLDNPQSVTIAGYNAFVTSKGDNALEIIDISNQSVPFHRGSLARNAGVAWLDEPVDCAVSADWKYAYVAGNGGNRLDIIDVTNPAAPVYRAGLGNGDGGALLENPGSVALYRSLAYVTSRGSDALEVAGSNAIPATGISVPASTRISGTFNLTTGTPTGSWDVIVTNTNNRFATLASGFSVTTYVPPTQPVTDSDDDTEPDEGAQTADKGVPGEAREAIKTNDLGQTLAPYTIETKDESEVDAEVSIPQSTKALTAEGKPIGEVTVVPVSPEAVTKVSGSAAAPEGAVFAAGGLGIECYPSGATFDQPVTISFTMTPAQWTAALAQAGGKTQDISVRYYDTAGKSWVSLPTTVDRTTRTVSATTRHFSLFAVFVRAATTPGSAAVQTISPQKTPTMSAVVHPTTAATPVTTTAPAPVQPEPGFPVVLIGAIAGSIAILIAAILLLRRWWIRRQNPALFREYD